MAGAVFMFFTYFMVTENEWVKHKLNINGDVFYSFLKPQVFMDFSNNQMDGPGRQQVMEAMATEIDDDAFGKKNIILITVDALRADRLSIYGYDKQTTPFLDSLDRANALSKIEYAFSNCATSFCGILSVLSGQHIFDLSFANFKIHDLFKTRNYKTAFLLGGAHNDWYYLKRAYEFYYPIDHYFEGPMSEEYGPSDDRGVVDALSKLEIVSDDPYFFYIHLMSPHQIGYVSEEHHKYLPVSKFNYLNPDSIVYSNTYDNGVYQADHYLRLIFEELEDKGILQNSLVVITSDHGEAIGENGRFGHSGDLYNYNTRIPMLFYSSDTSFVTSTSYTTQTDMVPTILDAIDMSVPSIWEKGLEQGSHLRYLRQNRHLGALLYKNEQIFKFMTTITLDDDKLFHINVDPHEEHDLLINQKDKYSDIYKLMKEAVKRRFL